MKKFTQQVIKPKQAEAIANHVEKFITYNFAKKSVTNLDLLAKNVAFFEDTTIPENILKQTLAKATFPRASFSKGSMNSLMEKSDKVEIAFPKELSDFRFIPERKTAANFAKVSSGIKKVVLNSENPRNASTMHAVTSCGNKYKDISILLADPTPQFSLDIKSGNNALKPFGGVLAEIPFVSSNKQVYNVMNTQVIDLDHIQELRSNFCQKFAKERVEYQELSLVINHIVTLPLDQIQKNIIIQEAMLKHWSDHIARQNPSFYYAYYIPKEHTIHSLFFEKLSPHITPDIFNNVKNAQQFIREALKTYLEVVDNVAENIEKSKPAWESTGFETIFNDLFK